MSWFGGSNVAASELDAKIEEATSESIPNGEVDIAAALEVTDIIRRKEIPPMNCMRALKKRLMAVHQNPNLTRSTLKLVDLCVKNGGDHFLEEIATREFMDYLVDYILLVRYNPKDPDVVRNEARYSVGQLVLTLLKQWSVLFQGKSQLSYVTLCVHNLESKNFEFPYVDTEGLSSKFVDSEVPPDWLDSDQCMICSSKFSLMNRKHHCRYCGGVYCGTHSSNFTPLPSLGIMEAVRVCDVCYEKVKAKNRDPTSTSRLIDARLQYGGGNGGRSNPQYEDDEEEQIRKALELSLQDTGVAVSAPSYPPPSQAPVSSNERETVNDEEDPEIKAAIEASLREYEMEKKARDPYGWQQQQQQQQQQQLQQENQSGPSYPPPSQSQQSNYTEEPSDPYQNLLPTNSTYSGSQQYAPTNPFLTPQHTLNAGNVPPTYPTEAPYENQQQQQQQQQPSYPPIPQQYTVPPQSTGPKVEYITPKEEDLINLFVTMVAQAQNDANKRTNIAYDQQLLELSSQVNALRPKLNKSLKNANERYDAFLQLHNKISTITKLYDQFLDRQLNSAWGNNMNISEPPQGAPVNANSSGTRIEPQHTPYPTHSPFTGDQAITSSRDELPNNQGRNSYGSQGSRPDGYGNVYAPNTGFPPIPQVQQQQPSMPPMEMPAYPPNDAVGGSGPQYPAYPPNDDSSSNLEYPPNGMNVYPNSHTNNTNNNNNNIALPPLNQTINYEASNAYESSPSPRTPIARKNEAGYPNEESLPDYSGQNPTEPRRMSQELPQASTANAHEPSKLYQSAPYPTLYPPSQSALFSGQNPVDAQPSGGTDNEESLEKASSRFPALEVVEREYEQKVHDSGEGEDLTRTSSHKSRYEPEPLIEL